MMNKSQISKFLISSKLPLITIIMCLLVAQINAVYADSCAGKSFRDQVEVGNGLFNSRIDFCTKRHDWHDVCKRLNKERGKHYLNNCKNEPSGCGAHGAWCHRTKDINA